MVKEKRLLSYILGWLIIGFIVCFVGIIKTYALTWNDIGYINDNSDVSIEVSYETESNTLLNIDRLGEYYTQIKALYINVSNYTFIADRHYLLELSLPMLKLTNANYYEVYDANNNKCKITNVITSFDSAYPNWEFQCNNTTDSITIKVYNTNNQDITQMGTFRWNYAYLRYSDTPINNTNEEIADNIINNQNQNTQDIINSNKETQEVIKDQFNECRESVNLIDYKNFTNINSYTSITIITNGLIIIKSNNASGYGVGSETLTLKPNTTYTISTNSNWNIPKNSNWGWRLYNVNDNIFGNVSKSDTYTFTTNNNTQYILYYYIGSPTNDIGEVTLSNIMLNEGSSPKSYEPYGEKICSNRIDETNDKLDGIQGALTDTSTPNLDGLENSIGWLPPGPVDSILNLPLTMLNSLTNSLNKTCSPLSIKLPYVNKNIQIPCLSAIFAQITGVNGLWTWVGAISSVLILYNYLLNLYAWVDKVLTLRAEFDEAMGADLANWGRL